MIPVMLPKEYTEDANNLQAQLRKELSEEGGKTKIRVVWGQKA